VKVPLGSRTYPIYIGSGILNWSDIFWKKHIQSHSVVLMTDTHVASLHLAALEKRLQAGGYTVRTIIIPAGEHQKNLRRAEHIYTQLLKWKIDRTSTIAAFGGGVIGDLAGFIAATYQRGVGFLQIPTTLLAQVDSSVGGKVGVNHPLAKNMIGAFYQPKFVLADVTVLQTLPARELVCGLGEIIKYGIILDKDFFSFTQSHLAHVLKYDTEVLKKMVKRSCELKANVVSSDEREQGLRTILNFGHTIGHALERAGGYSRLKHGEAILYGMIAETSIAHSLSFLSSQDKNSIETVISAIPLPKLSHLNMSVDSLMETMMIDKKSAGGNIRMVLPQRIGKVSLPVVVSPHLIRKAITYLKEYAS
jgi:3-dehydroquinate synthase